jgi:hypothetical protein
VRLRALGLPDPDQLLEAGLARAPQVDGLDAFEPNVEMCQKRGFYRRVWHQELPSPLVGTWDTVLACEIIEHLPQKHVEAAIESMEKATKKRVIFSTPNWPYMRGGGETAVGFNTFEAHLSYASRKMFQRRGYKIIGAGFGNPRHPLVKVVNRLPLPESAVAALQSLPRAWAALGAQLIAYKDL